MKPLEELISGYRTEHAEEAAYIGAFLELLKHPDAFERNHLPGHITGSAWILDRSLDSVALVLHGKLGRWMQPGGHADGDRNVVRVALRETEEETGLTPQSLTDGIWDLDIHPIPARKDMPAHLHYDVRFCFQDFGGTLRISAESSDLKWIPISEVSEYTDSQSVIRMVDKTIQFRNQWPQ